MKYRVVINLSQEDLAALAHGGYNSPKNDGMGKPRQGDIQKFVEDSVKDRLHHLRVFSGAGRRKYIEFWNK